MAFQPAASLTNRTFVGLIVAQFLAGFNDQAIHAMAMFYAIRTGILSEANAISLMPILFYAPWAIFCTLAGYYADRYSKTYTLVLWRLAEVVVAVILIGGFYLGTELHNPAGGWVVMACVFLMGTHAAFFAPAKYGAMPEILQAHVLSRGNGILESTTFLASITGTVTGGLLMTQFRGNELWIGLIMLVLAIIGAVASFLIAYLPPANTARTFPYNPVAPLWANLKVLFNSRALALSVTGIAFFIFMVAYMRGSVYMHGESRHWTEARTSLIVAMVALGVGFGSPLAGYLSGGKIELGLVPLGCVGMMLATLAAGLAIDNVGVLVAALIVIGFFSGFYMVPLYTLLQHRAPKQSKGDLVATSNFINVTGAISASVLFNVLVQISHLTGMAPPVSISVGVARGPVEQLVKDEHGDIRLIVVKEEIGAPLRFEARPPDPEAEDPTGQVFKVTARGLAEGNAVVVDRYKMGNVTYFRVRSPEQPWVMPHDYAVLPRYLFIGASAMTLAILVLLLRKLPDFFTRTLFWLRSLGRFHLREVGLHRLPTSGPVVLAANCKDLESSLQLVSVTDRTTKVILPTSGQATNGGLLGALARRSSLIELPLGASPEVRLRVKRVAEEALAQGHLLAIGVDGPEASDEVDSLLREVRADTAAPVVPVFCGPLDPAEKTPRVRVVFGQAPAEGASVPELRQEIHKLGEWIRANDAVAGLEHH